MKNNFSLIKFQLRKKSNILSIIVIGIAMSIIILLGTYNESQRSAVTHETKDYIYARLLWVGKQGDIEDNIKELNNVKYITNVVNSYEYQHGMLPIDEFKTKKLTGDIWLMSSNNKSLPKIVKGTNFPDDNGYYMICPANFYPTNSYNIFKKLSIYDKFDIDKYLNKEINFEYFGNNYHYARENPNINPDDYIFNINIKLIGLYKNDDYNIDENICFVNNKTLHDIVKNEFKDDIDPVTKVDNYELQKGSQIVEVDDASHVKLVEEELKKLGYSIDYMFETDYESLDKTNANITLICSLIIIIIAIFMYLMLEKDYEENKDYYNLLHILGYNNKEINKIYLNSCILKIFFWIIISLLISIIVCLIGSLIIKIYPFLIYKYRIVYDYKYVLIVLGLSVIVTLINYLVHRKRKI